MIEVQPWMVKTALVLFVFFALCAALVFVATRKDAGL